MTIWRAIGTHIPHMSAWLSAAACAIIPYACHRLNRYWRKTTDPPWKRRDDDRKRDPA